MSKGYIVRGYRTMSPEDRRTFDRWLKANAVVGLIIAAGLVAMALVGSNSVSPRDTAVANNARGSNVAASEKRHKQSVILPSQGR